jgi:hypothetical protein
MRHGNTVLAPSLLCRWVENNIETTLTFYRLPQATEAQGWWFDQLVDLATAVAREVQLTFDTGA